MKSLRSLHMKIRIWPQVVAGVITLCAAPFVPQARPQSADELDLNLVGIVVRTCVVQPDGKILIGGSFTHVLGVARNNIARLNKDGTLDTAFNPDVSGGVHAIAVQADGRILVGGEIFAVGGQTRNFLARLDATTGAPDAFNPDPQAQVTAIAIQADGKILVGGSFEAIGGANSIGGQPRNNIARLDSSGLADSFNPDANAYVTSIAILPDGKILAGGIFSVIGGQVRNCLARLDPTTGLPDSFNPDAGPPNNGGVSAIAVQPDGKILVAGAFRGIGGQPRLGLARLDADTGLADSFNPNPNQSVVAMAIQADGKILVGGGFTNIGGQPRNRIARLDATSGLADSFNPNASSDNPDNPFTAVYSVGLQTDGKVLATGDFTHIGGQTRRFFARLSNDAPTPGLVGNVATRLPVGTGDNALIQGFIVQGPAGSAKKIMVRALGPFLTQFGITDALPNPILEIRDANNLVVATNNDWETTQVGGIITGDQSGEINASGLAPSDDLESAIIADLLPGNYTAMVRGVGDTTGTGIVDAYDMSAGSPARLANIATRGFIQPGDKLMIAGFIIQNGSVRAAVRAIGPSLTQFGITNALPDTTLELRDQNGAIILENDDWQTNSAQKQELESNGLQPGHDLEAALIMTIPPGQYTAQVRGKGQASGIGVVEVYFLQ